ncbi:hypothetical protein D8B26_003942 [Coccidioides posadasii str. Silveira]|uniref:Uncharacterized protein n=1 Tax=Coccidioides posadasii (strain RMSCC 757 / Silveira) TaxID=443226 RepID=E9D9G8_COCPS|nr:hypothetical protein CPSG_06470 [Coccidioides posadasii str. Silveira]QVM09279.1 hypothetical protein D8B26_003942 [Coccidioides posadasii str. Silveira]
MTSGVTGSHEPELSMPTHQNSVLPTEVSAPQPVADIYNGRGEEYRVPGGPPRQIRKKAPEKQDEIPQKPRVELDDFGLPIRKARPSPDSNSRPAIATTGKSTGSTDNLPLRSKTEDSLARQNLTRSVSAPVRDIDRSKKNPEPDTIIDTDQQTKEIADRTLKKSAVDTSEQSQPNQEPSEIEKLGGQSDTLAAAPAVSEWSHQRLTTKDESTDSEDDERWQAMPALGSFDVYDDYGRLVARGSKEEDEEAVYQGLGGAGKGYTRVQIDEDAQSATSLDEETKYLFPEPQNNALGIEDDIRDPMSQLQATKTLLTEGQRIAYVGVTRLIIFQMVKDLEGIQSTKSARKYLADAADATAKWGQQMMIRLYGHMEIDAAEQVMIEQLAEHGVQPADLVPPLMQNSRVKNPAADCSAAKDASDSASSKADRPASSVSGTSEALSTSTSPPPYSEHQNDDLPEVRTPSQLPSSKKLDIDLRWTVLCDLFLVLIADSTYDARSRCLLERVAETMDISWMQICRFEKRVVDALEMQEERNKETWDEAEHMEKRRKEALKRRYMIMGLATVGGGLVIGLSAGLLAPVIGAGLAAGFTTIGVSGTGAFLGGVGGTALITSGATLTGSTIGIRASNRRTGAVKTFEYRPLHNNKRLNLIVTAAGWMTGKVDDVRLPYSTVDPVMGDIYSILWEPEMLQSMGATINILATEALTQGLQQVLGSTILTALMASLQLPIVLTKLSYLIDNPWNVSLARANASGLILADSLIDRNLGNRPVTLLGFSLGSRLIFSCLKELANKRAYGIVQNVYLFGSPVVANKDEYLKARSVVSGRFVNGYASNDWILGYLFRATSGGIMRVAGLAPVEGIPGIENFDATKFVNGHMAYRAAMPRLLREVGWEVESDEFTEIEDPDPDSHQERQRELIREIQEARKQAEEKPDKKKFGFFKRGKLAEKKGWETYDVDQGDRSPTNSCDGNADPGGTVLFDIDAIRAELASEQIQVKQLESTLPPIRLHLNPPSPVASPSFHGQKKAPLLSTELEEAAIESHTASDSPSEPADARLQDFKPLPDLPSDGNPFNESWRQEEIQMTFDTAYHQTPSTTSPSLAESGNHELGPVSSNLTPLHSVTQSPTETHNDPPRLAHFDKSGLNHNAWATDDDDSSIKLSFA